MNVTVIGAGNMGSAFVKQLLAAGHQVCVTAISTGQAEALAAQHDGVRASPSHGAASDADAVILPATASAKATVKALAESMALWPWTRAL